MGQNPFYFAQFKKVCEPFLSKWPKLPYYCFSDYTKSISLNQTGDKALTSVWDISTWKKIGHKRLLKKSAAVMSVSKDGKYLAL